MINFSLRPLSLLLFGCALFSATVNAALTTELTDIPSWNADANVLPLRLAVEANTGLGNFALSQISDWSSTDVTSDFLDTRYRPRANSLFASTSPGTFDENVSVNRQDLTLGMISSNDGLNFSTAVNSVPATASLFPLVGLLVAISSTYILRRRKMQRLAVSFDFP